MRDFCKLLMCLTVLIGTSVAHAGLEEELAKWAQNHDSSDVNLQDLPEAVEDALTSMASDLLSGLQQQNGNDLQDVLDSWKDAHEDVDNLLFSDDLQGGLLDGFSLDDLLSNENMLLKGGNGWISGVVCQPGGYMPAGETECKRCKGGFACPGGLFYVDKIYTTDRGIVECENGSNSSRTVCNKNDGSSAKQVKVSSSTSDEEKDKIVNLLSGMMVNWDNVASVEGGKGVKSSKVATVPVERSAIGVVQQRVVTPSPEVLLETDTKTPVYQRSARAVPETSREKVPNVLSGQGTNTKRSVRASGGVVGRASRNRDEI